MVVLIIALLIGLIFFFIGLSLIEINRKELENEPVEIEESRRELKEEELIAPPPERNGTYLLALLLGAEGLLLSVISLVGLLIHGFLVKIPLYISIPALVVYILVCGAWNSLKMYKE